MEEFGKIYPEIVKNPAMYIVEQPELKEILNKLKRNKKQIFLTANTHV